MSKRYVSVCVHTHTEHVLANSYYMFSQDEQIYTNTHMLNKVNRYVRSPQISTQSRARKAAVTILVTNDNMIKRPS